MKHAFPPEWREGVFQAIARRRDIRSFLPDPVPRDVLARVLWAAHHAGSVGFMQPWNFIVIEDLAIRRSVRAHVEAERVRAAEAFDASRRAAYLSFKLEGILDAPLNICVTCDRQRFGPAVLGRHTIRETDLYSTCAAIQNLWLAARAEGLGVGWVSILQPQELRCLLEIPEHVMPVAYLCVGFAADFPTRPMLETTGWLPRLALSDVVYSNRWGSPPVSELSDALGAEDIIDVVDRETAADAGLEDGS
ncbi:MAG TPA: 5,6-dimethylbenzimidazole synthase [Xanthobacteraceae bacterium]|nr:5,6-dimethylbenzimidazole synthase [Xanthobacteraceae bacterium]